LAAVTLEPQLEAAAGAEAGVPFFMAAITCSTICFIKSS